jgi:ketosteroid isomerase-like protein
MATWFEEYLGAWATEDVDKVMAWMDDDIEFEDTTVGHKATGKERMAKFVAGSFKAVPGAWFDFVKGADMGDDYYIEWIMQPANVRGVSVGTRRDGKIRNNRDYWDGKKYTIG